MLVFVRQKGVVLTEMTREGSLILVAVKETCFVWPSGHHKLIAISEYLIVRKVILSKKMGCIEL
jgi:hypothetical protein